MSEFKKTQGWSKGVNNMAQDKRVPDGFVRHAVNVDATPDGILASRIGYERLYQGTAVRGVLSLGQKLLVADGTDLVEVDASGGSRVLRTIAGAGQFVGAELNGTLYFSTANECLKYDGVTVSRWGVPDVFYQPVVSETAGSLPPGHYQVAMTLVDTDGVEGGTDRPVVIKITSGAIIVFVPPLDPGYKANIYVSAVDGDTLYLQQTVAGDTEVVVSIVRDDRARCQTVLARAPTPATRITKHNASLVMVDGSTVWWTKPMQPHLIDRTKGFVQYPTTVGEVGSDGALFVSADKCYALTNIETDDIAQSTVLEFPAYSGTGVTLSDGRFAWMTKYGQAISDAGKMTLVNSGSFVPAEAAAGAAGVVDHNGSQTIITTTRNSTGGNSMAAADYFLGEILNR